MNPGGVTQLLRTISQLFFAALFAFGGYLSSLSGNEYVRGNSTTYIIIAVLWLWPVVRAAIWWARAMAKPSKRMLSWEGSLLGPFMVGMCVALFLAGAVAGFSASDVRMALPVMALFPLFSLNPKVSFLDGDSKTMLKSRLFLPKVTSLADGRLKVHHGWTTSRSGQRFPVYSVVAFHPSVEGHVRLTPERSDLQMIHEWCARIQSKLGLPVHKKR